VHRAHPDTHTHTHLYIIISYYRRDKRCRRTRGVLVQCRPAAARTPTHTQTLHSLGRHPTLTANRAIILLSTDFVIIILQYVLYRRVYNNCYIRGL